MSEIYLLLFAN